eukprot:Opistho-2@32739
MASFKIVLALVAVIAAFGVAAAMPAATTPYTYLGVFSCTSPGFLNFLPIDGKLNLFISSFTGNPLKSGSIEIIQNVGVLGKSLSNSNVTVASLGSANWPNEISKIPDEVFGKDYVLVADGFLVPGKSTGSLYALDVASVSAPTKIKLTTDNSGYFYHMGTFVDWNGDGHLDIVTARANKGVFGSGSGLIAWLENPGSEPAAGPWKEHVIENGPDVFFSLTDVDGDGRLEIIAAQFFSSKITISYASSSDYATATWTSRTIEDTIGAVFDLSLVDINGDGKLDILATNHVSDASLSGVYVYEIPADIKTGAFTRHTLASGIVTKEGGFNQASPGAAFAFHASTTTMSGKPLIALGGDGSQQAYLLTPKSTDASSWDYDLAVVIDVAGTVGQVAIADVDGDGFNELFVPNYDKSEIHAFTFRQ